MDKKKLNPLARFRGFIQAGATLLTNIHLPNFAKAIRLCMECVGIG